MRLKRFFLWTIGAFAILLSGPAVLLVTEDQMGQRWHEASTGSARMAPLPADHDPAVVQIYAARAWGWRGAVAVHSWISVKPAGASEYTVYQVIGWRSFYNRPVLSIEKDVPDRYWYGKRPEVLFDLRGAQAQTAIEQIHQAVLDYPYPRQYRVWPGPNSNTFVAWIARRVPALRVDLPPTFIGKDWLGATRILARAPSGTGYQISVLGALGVTVGIEEGIEFNFGCAHFGVDPLGLAVRLPGWGIIGLRS